MIIPNISHFLLHGSDLVHLKSFRCWSFAKFHNNPRASTAEYTGTRRSQLEEYNVDDIQWRNIYFSQIARDQDPGIANKFKGKEEYRAAGVISQR